MLPAGGPVGANFFILCMLPGPDPISSSLLNPLCALCTQGMENWGPKAMEKREAEFCEEITELPMLLESKQSNWPELLNHMSREICNL